MQIKVTIDAVQSVDYPDAASYELTEAGLLTITLESGIRIAYPPGGYRSVELPAD